MRQRLDSIQGLRALAALLVLFCHSPHSLWFFKLGYSGVDLFFVLSGFIMVVSTADQSGVPAFKRFVISRFSRIWPVYAVTSAIMAAVFCLIGYLPVHDVVARLLHDLTFQPAWNDPPINAPGWSLTFEVYFYTLFAVSLLFGRWRYPALLVALVTALLMHDPGGRADGPWGYVALVTSPICACFVAGVVAGLIYRSRWRGIPFWLAVCGLVVSTGLTAYFLFLSANEFNHGFAWAVSYGGMVLSIALMEKRRRVWMPQLLVWFGNASLSVYVSQWLMIIILGLYGPPIIASTQIMLHTAILWIGVAAVSFMTFHLLEKILAGWVKAMLTRLSATDEGPDPHGLSRPAPKRPITSSAAFMRSVGEQVVARNGPELSPIGTMFKNE